MRAARLFVVVVIVTLFLAAALLLPGREENAAMLASEGRHREAIALLQRQLVDAPNDPNLLAALGRSYAALGEIDQAVGTFEAYLALRPDDAAARLRQAELLLQAGMIDRYLAAFSRAVAAQPSREDVTRLVELYRLHGRVEDEVAALRAYAGSGLLEPLQLERLGAILAGRGEWHAARHWLELADRSAPPEASAGRFLLLDVLIELGETDLALQRASAWMAAWRHPYLSGRLILRMARAGLVEQASMLAQSFVDQAPDDSLELAELLVGKGQSAPAHHMLTRWADRVERPSEEQLQAFVRASARVGDLQGPILKMMQLARGGSDPAAAAQYAEVIADVFGLPAVAAIRGVLSNEVLRARPLFAARLALFEGNRESARWFLQQIEPDQLSPEQSAAWLALLRQVETEAGVFARLATLWDQGRLPADLVPPLADEALKLHLVTMHDRIWHSMQR